MKKITQKQNKLNSKTILASVVFLISALFLAQAQDSLEIEVLPGDPGSFIPTGGVHTMTSAETPSPGGGTFTVSYDVHIPDGDTFYIGGSAPRQWGLSHSRFFDAAGTGDATDICDNIVVTIVDDNGGALTTGAFSKLKFTKASLGGATANNDAGYFTYKGVEDQKFEFTQQPTSPSDFIFTRNNVASFNVGTSNNGVTTNNKWGIASVTISVTVNTTTASTQEFSGLLESRYKLYPNPASDDVTVESEAGATITIYSITGRSVLEISNATEVQQINIGSLDRGIYLVSVNDAVSKLVIE